jgi:hypothetical protein
MTDLLHTIFENTITTHNRRHNTSEALEGRMPALGLANGSEGPEAEKVKKVAHERAFPPCLNSPDAGLPDMIRKFLVWHEDVSGDNTDILPR